MHPAVPNPARAYRRIARAPERGDIDELAAALYQMADAAGPGPGSHGRRQEK
jgi:hypothetical protein